MSEGLREFDDSIGRCSHCNKLVFKDEELVIRKYTHDIAHRKCEREYMEGMLQV